MRRRRQRKQVQSRKFSLAALSPLPCSYFSAKDSRFSQKKIPGKSHPSALQPGHHLGFPGCSLPKAAFLNFSIHSCQSFDPCSCSTSPGLVLIHPGSLCGHQSLGQSCKDHFPKLVFLAHALCTLPCQLCAFYSKNHLLWVYFILISSYFILIFLKF